MTDMCGVRQGHISRMQRVFVGVSLSKRPTQAYKDNENVLLTRLGNGRIIRVRRMCAKEGHTSIIKGRTWLSEPFII